LVGLTMVSDAFFPFRDGVDVGIKEDTTAVIQPGGSANDYQSIETCNEANVTMVYNGQRILSIKKMAALKRAAEYSGTLMAISAAINLRTRSHPRQLRESAL
jgi:hypothetical protein